MIFVLILSACQEQRPVAERNTTLLETRVGPVYKPTLEQQIIDQLGTDENKKVNLRAAIERVENFPYDVIEVGDFVMTPIQYSMPIIQNEVYVVSRLNRIFHSDNVATEYEYLVCRNQNLGKWVRSSNYNRPSVGGSVYHLRGGGVRPGVIFRPLPEVFQNLEEVSECLLEY